MSSTPSASIETALRHYQAAEYGLAAAQIREIMNTAAPDAMRALCETVARAGDRLTLFPDDAHAAAAEPFFQHLLVAARSSLGDASPHTATLSRQFATILTIQGRIEEAAALLSQTLARLTPAQGPHDSQVRAIRDQLAIQFRALNRQGDIDALYADTGICEDLLPVEQYIRSQGVKVNAVGTPWSRNCRTWVTFEKVVLDADALIRRFKLPDYIGVHTFRDNWQGAEHGLVCHRHHDALIALHPDPDLSRGARVIR